MNGSRLIATAILANSTIHYFKKFNLFFNHFEHNYLKIIPTELFVSFRALSLYVPFSKHKKV